jgi:MGT family glycosyltransferase
LLVNSDIILYVSKIVYLAPPAYGHVNPGLPVVQELTQRGEQVICYNTQEFRSPIERTGAAFRPYPTSDISSTEISRVLQGGNLANVTALIMHSTGQLVPFVLDELARETPDLIIFDSIALWGKMAATQLRLRAAAFISHLVMDEKHMKTLDLLRMLRQYLPQVPGILRTRRRLIQQYGKTYPLTRPLFPMRDRLNIVFTTRDLQPETPIIDETFRFVGPSINPQIRSEDFPFDALRRRPVVYISLGTVHSIQPEFFNTCFKAFADFQAQFIVSVGRHINMDALGSIPANFIVRPSVPQLEVLQHTDVFITHGGINSVHEGLYYGVPLILIPHQFEQLLNARCVATHGAGMIIEARLQGKPATAAMLRQTLNVILTESSYGEAAKKLQQSLRATGGYQEAADHVQAYISRKITVE